MVSSKLQPGVFVVTNRVCITLDRQAYKQLNSKLFFSRVGKANCKHFRTITWYLDQMDLNFIRKLSISTTVWLCLYISISSTTIISRATSFIFVTWTVYTVSVAIAFTSLKLWNRSLQEPLLDVNFTHLETGISIILAVLVAVFGAILMQLDAMKDFVSSQILTFVMTTCQFNLLKVSQIGITNLTSCILMTATNNNNNWPIVCRAFNPTLPRLRMASIELSPSQGPSTFVFFHHFYLLAKHILVAPMLATHQAKGRH